MTADLHPDTSEPRPGTCCGVCPPIAGGGWDCTCAGNPRCSVSAPAAEWDDLARLAHAATPGPWRAALLDGVSHEDGSSSHRGGIYPGTAPGPPPLFVTNSIDKRDAKFIAAANPATILRLIEDNRYARDTALRAIEVIRRVEALVDALEQVVPPKSAAVMTTALRAALAAPTDTTKENS